MIKKLTAGTLVLALSASTTFAEEAEKSGEYYVAVKALMTMGDTVTEEDNTKLKGQTGGGIGIDFGYTLPYHFALELDGSYDRTDVQETRPSEEPKTLQGTFWTYAMDLTYTLPVTNDLGIMAKVGYEFERETIGGTNGHDSGTVYGAALEYRLSKHYETLMEYEGSTVDSPRGSSLYAGVKYIF